MQLSPEAREARRQYLKEWRKRNPEKVKQHTRDYWERKAREMKENGKRD